MVYADWELKDPSSVPLPVTPRAGRFIKNYLLLGLATAVFWGLAWPEPGALLSSVKVAQGRG